MVNIILEIVIREEISLRNTLIMLSNSKEIDLIP
jgi:hypothetical protein|tara:strand:+ start:92 stop:193 length:102 start_codon:yes stop_codon:yes gene_type:complete